MLYILGYKISFARLYITSISFCTVFEQSYHLITSWNVILLWIVVQNIDMPLGEKKSKLNPPLKLNKPLGGGFLWSKEFATFSSHMLSKANKKILCNYMCLLSGPAVKQGRNKKNQSHSPANGLKVRRFLVTLAKSFTFSSLTKKNNKKPLLLFAAQLSSLSGSAVKQG